MSLEIRKYVHVFMGDTNNVYTVVTAQIKHDVVAFRKTIVSFSDISTMPAIMGALG